MQDVEPMRLVPREQRRGQRVDYRFARTIGQREEPGTDVQAPVCSFLAGACVDVCGRESHDSGSYVKKEGEQHEPAIADPVGNEAEDDDGHAEAEQTAAGDRTKLRLGEAELLAPVLQDRPANGEADARGDEGEEAGPEEHFLVEAGLRGGGGPGCGDGHCLRPYAKRERWMGNRRGC